MMWIDTYVRGMTAANRACNDIQLWNYLWTLFVDLKSRMTPDLKIYRTLGPACASPLELAVLGGQFVPELVLR